MFKQVFPNVYNVSGSHSYQHITFLAVLQTEVFNRIKGRKIVCITTFFLQFVCNHLGRHTQCIGFAGCVDISQDHMVCMCQGIYELRE